jgi:hypothetical protein
MVLSENHVLHIYLEYVGEDSQSQHEIKQAKKHAEKKLCHILLKLGTITSLACGIGFYELAINRVGLNNMTTIKNRVMISS